MVQFTSSTSKGDTAMEDVTKGLRLLDDQTADFGKLTAQLKNEGDTEEVLVAVFNYGGRPSTLYILRESSWRGLPGVSGGLANCTFYADPNYF